MPGTSLTDPAPGTPDLGPEAPVYAASDLPDDPRDLSAATVDEARTLAAAKDKRVVVSSLLDATSTTYANPDGTLTTHSFAGPVRTLRGSTWAAIDTTLLPFAGRIAPAVTSTAVSFSSGGDSALVRESVPGKGTVGLDWPTTLPIPTVAGSTATYANAAGPDQDLVLQASPSGFEFSIVLRTRPATAPVFTLPVTLSGALTLRAAGTAGAEVVDDSGVVVARLGDAVLHDATVDPMTEQPAHEMLVPGGVSTDSSGGWVLTLSPDAAFLADPATTYPATIDPSLTLTDNKDTYVSSAYTTTSYYNATDLHVGYYNPPTPAAVGRSYLAFNMGAVLGNDVLTASMFLYDQHQWACNEPMKVFAGKDFTSSTDWSNQPGAASNTIYAQPTLNAGDTCGGAKYVSFSVLGLAQRWAGGTSTLGDALIEASDETVNLQYREFASANAGSSQAPYVSTTYATPPGAPTNVVATRGNAQGTVTWSAPSSNGGSAITSYTVELHASAGGTLLATHTGITGTSYTATGLTNGTAYYFKIYAVNAAGTGAGTMSNVFTPAGPPGVPTNVTASANTTSCKLTWGPANANGSAITGYTVKLFSTAAGVNTLQSTTSHPATDSSETDTCVAGTQYFFTIFATNAVGNSSTVTSSTVTAGPNGDPQNVAATGGDQSVTVTWQNPSNDGPPLGPSVTSYTVKLWTGSTQVGATVTAAATARTYTFNAASGFTVVNGTTYTVTVAANTANGTSNAISSNPVTAGPALPPGNVVATADNQSVSVSWTAPSNDGPRNGPSVVTYTVRLYNADTGGALVATHTDSSSATSDTFSPETNGTHYYVTVTSNTDYNGSSTAVTSNTVVPGLPFAPQNVTATGGADTATVSWTAPSNDGPPNGPPVTGYVVKLYDEADPANPTLIATAPEQSSTARTYSFSNPPTNGESVAFVVTADSANGLGADGTSNTVLVADAPDAPPGAVSAAEDGGVHYGTSSATVQWSIPGDNGSMIDKYYVQALDPSTGQPNGPNATVTCLPPNGCGAPVSGDVTGLAYGSSYAFRVAAHNSATPTRNSDLSGTGWGPWSAASNTITIGRSATVTKTLSAISSDPDQTTWEHGQAALYTIAVTNPNSAKTLTVNMTDPLGPMFDLGSTTPVIDTTSSLSPGTTSGCVNCSVNGANLLILNQSIQPGETRTYKISGVFTGAPSTNTADSARLCQTLLNTVSLADDYSGNTPAGQSTATPAAITATAPQATICNADLGVEPWWSYVTKTIGVNASASVNVANGNLVVTSTDGTPISAHGRLAFVLRRTYNSQDNVLETLPGSFGKGWVLNLGATDDLAGDGVTATGLEVPTVQTLANAATNPLSVTLIDRDGTRHVFTPQLLPNALNTTGLSNGGSTFAPRSLTLPGVTYTNLCIDTVYTPPAGVHLALWRYIAVRSTAPTGSAPCAAANRDTTTTPAVVGYGTERPDRLRAEFRVPLDAVTLTPSLPVGELTDLSDGAGNTLHYTWNNLAQLTGVTDAACVASPCRQLSIHYYDSTGVNEITNTATALTQIHMAKVVDPAGRTTTYTFASTNDLAGTPLATAFPHGARLLVSVQNPDGSTVHYGYQGDGSTPNCNGATGQLCTVTDERGKITQFGYDGAASSHPTLGLPRVSSITDRRLFPTTLTYSSSNATVGDSVTVNEAPNGSPSDRAGSTRSQVFGPIDGQGRVAQLLEGASGVTTSNAMRTTQWTWDGTDLPGRTPVYCRSSNAQIRDNNLCTLTGLGSGGSNAPNAVSSYVYDDAGMLQKQTVDASTTSTTASLVTTYGYTRLYSAQDGTLSSSTEAVGDGGTVTAPTPPAGPVLFTLADRTAMVPPRGNVGTASHSSYQTTYTIDDLTSAAPNTSGSAQPCQANGLGTATGNTGLLCATSRPTSAGTAISRNGYDVYGEKTVQASPRGNQTTYAYYPDGTTDLSGTTGAGGWLKTVTDATNHYVAFGYDAAGNMVRAWDRNATDGNAASLYPGSIANPGPGPFSQTLYGTNNDTTATSAIQHPWRFISAQKDTAGNTTVLVTDPAGNVTSSTDPRGNQTTYTYDAAGLLLSTLTPAEAQLSPTAPTLRTYDAYGELATVTSPNQAQTNAAAQVPAGQNASSRIYYDTVGRVVETATVRELTPPASSPPACFTAGSNDPALPSGALVCRTFASYDSLDNRVSTTDPDGQVATYSYDAAGRRTDTFAPSNTPGSSSTLHTRTLYDADGNVTTVCHPRQYTEGGGTCADTATGYVVHNAYDVADQHTSTSTYRSVGGAAQTTTIGYDLDGNVISSQDPNTHTTSYAYDALDRRTTTTVPRDAGTSFSTYNFYDPVGDTVATIRPGASASAPYTPARVTASTFDADHRVVDTVTGLTVTLPDTSNLLNPANLTAITTALAANTATGTSDTRYRTVYDPAGNIIARYDPRAFTGSVPSATAGTPAGAFTSDFMLRTDYDADNRPIAQYTVRTDGTVTDPNTGAIAGGSPEASQCTGGPVPSGAPAFTSTARICATLLTRDPDGNVTQVTLPTVTYGTGGRSNRTLIYRYSADDQLKQINTPDPAANATGTGRVNAQTFTLDGTGRHVATTDALNVTSTVIYTPGGTVAETDDPTSTAGIAHKTTYAYDANGNRIQATVPRMVGGTLENDTTSTAYTADDKVASVSTPASSTTDLAVTSYTYDAAGNTIQITPPAANASTKDANNTAGLGTTNTYTSDNLLLTTLAPFAPDGSKMRRTSYSYDPAGRKTSVVTDLVGPTSTGNPVLTAGQAQSFAYALDDRLLTQTGRGASERITAEYDAAGDQTCWLDGPNSGSPSCASPGASTSTISASYYLDGLLRSTSETHGAASRTSSFSYDGSGSPIARANDTGTAVGRQTTTYTSNDAGLPVSMYSPLESNGTTSWTYNSLGQVASEADPNNTSRTWTYDNGDHTLSDTKVSSGAAVLADYSYTYDELYRILTQAYTGTLAGGTTTSSATLSYAYDAGGRLTSYTNGSAASFAMTWDHDGNRLTYGAQKFTYNADDSLATSNSGGIGALDHTMTYDASGRLTDDACNTNGYDGFDRLTSVTPDTVALDTSCAKNTVTYAYDGADRQTSRTSSTLGANTVTTQLFYDGLSQRVVGETYSGGTGPTTLDYALSPQGTPEAALTTGSGGAVQYLADDGTGSTATITTSTGGASGMACALRYDPFGNPVQNNNNTAPATGPCYTGTTAVDALYHQGRRDSATGNYQLGSRTYDPTKNTFYTPDTYRNAPSTANLAVGTDPLTRNTYNYVNGDPVNLIDPDGHATCAQQGDAICPGLTPAAMHVQFRRAAAYEQREFFASVVSAWRQQLVQQFQAGAKAFLGNHCDAGNASPACMAASGFYDYLNSGPQQDSELRRLVLQIIGDKEAVRDSAGINAIIDGIATLPLGGAGFLESLLGRGGAEAVSATVTKTVGETIAGAAVGDSRALAVTMLKELAEAGGSDLAQNVARGKIGNMLMRVALEDAGFSNITSEVTFKTLAGVRFRADFVAQLGGRTFVFESKTGGAFLSSGQQAGFAALEAGDGLIPVGAKAAAAGLRVGSLDADLGMGQAWWALG